MSEEQHGTTDHLSLLDSLPVMILDIDRDGVLQFANQRLREQFGLSRNPTHLVLSDILDEYCVTDAMRQIHDLFSHEGDIATIWYLKSGHNQPMAVGVNAITIYESGYPVRVRVFFHDGSDHLGGHHLETLSPDLEDVKSALKEEQEYTNTLIQKSGLLIYILDTRNNIIEINKKMEDLLGINRQIAPNLEAMLKLLYPDERYRVIIEKIHQNMYKNQHIRDTELNMVSTSGELKHVSWSTARLKNSHGHVHGFIAMGYDTTEKRRVEQWMKLQLDSIDKISEFIILFDNQGNVINALGAVEQFTGYLKKDLLSKSFKDLFDIQTNEHNFDSLKTSLEHNKNLSTVLELINNSKAKIQLDANIFYVSTDKNSPAVMSFVLKKQASSTNERQHDLQKDANRHIALTDKLHILESQLEERDIELLLYKEQLEVLQKSQKKELEETTRVTSRSALDEAIKELSIYQMQILGIASIAIVTMDHNGTIVSWSKGAEEFTKISEQNAIQKQHDDVFKLEERSWESIQAEAVLNGKTAGNYTLVTQQGNKIPITTELTVLSDEGGTPLGYAQVATRATQKATSDIDPELLDAKSMSLLGELTAIIVRELQDAFSVINHNYKRLNEYTTDLRRVIELYRSGALHRDIESFVRRIDLKGILSDLDFLFEETHEEMLRIKNLAQDTKTYLPDATPLDARYNLNELVESSISLLKTYINQRTRLELNYLDSVVVYADRNRLMRIILNTLLICLRSFSQMNNKKNEITIRTALDGQRAVLEITHNGTAVGSDVLQHLDNQKALAKQHGSTAVGLGIIRQLLRSINGTFEVLPASLQGNSFLIQLPASFNDDKLLSTPDIPEKSSIQNQILFIDDDKNELRSYRRFFERYYHVFVSDSYEETFHTLSFRQDFTAIVLDIVFPEPDGIKLYQQIVEKYPSLIDRIIILLPVGISQRSRDLLLHSGRPVIHKPIEFDSLLTVIKLIAKTTKK